MKIILKIQRFNAEKDSKPYFQEYEVEAEADERLLDAMMRIKRFQDGSLAFRKSCAHGVCGSDAMRINGKDALACKVLIKDLVAEHGETITVEPLRHLAVLRDLIVDQGEFFAKYRSIKPYLINDEAVPEKERLQSQQERLVFDDTTNCILCAACYSACPVISENRNFLGPAAVSQAFRFLADSRDRGFGERLQVLNAADGAWPCDNKFECTKACPRSILITKRINQTKRMITDHHQE